MYTTIFFDLDGTLTNSEEGITKSVAFALKNMGVEDCDNLSSLRKFIGPPLSVSFAEYFTGDDIAKATAEYRKRYSVVGWKENHLYDGVTEMLEVLKSHGKKLYVATSKPIEFTEQILALFNIDKYFDGVAADTISGLRHTKKAVVEYALTLCAEKDKSKILMVGDRFHDVEGAGALGIKTLGVSYGFGGTDELINAGAIHVSDSAKDVVDFILNS